jgi:hypothetical protein
VLDQAFHQHDPGTSHTMVEPKEKALPLKMQKPNTSLVHKNNHITITSNVHEAKIHRTYQCR